MAQFGAGIVDSGSSIIPSASYLPYWRSSRNFDFTFFVAGFGVSVDFVLTTLAASDWVRRSRRMVRRWSH